MCISLIKLLFCWMQPLATCMHKLQLEKMAISLQISEPWLREYQVWWLYISPYFPFNKVLERGLKNNSRPHLNVGFIRSRYLQSLDLHENYIGLIAQWKENVLTCMVWLTGGSWWKCGKVKRVWELFQKSNSMWDPFWILESYEVFKQP